MDGSTFVVEVVGDANLDPVSPVGLNQGPRELAVDDNDAPFDSIRRKDLALESPVVVSGYPGIWAFLILVAAFRRAAAPGISIRKRVVAEEVGVGWSIEGTPFRLAVGLLLGEGGNDRGDELQKADHSEGLGGLGEDLLTRDFANELTKKTKVGRSPLSPLP